MNRVIAFDENRQLVALTGEEFEQLSDVEMTRGLTLPGLLDAVYLSSSGTVDKATGYTTTSPCIGFVVAILPLGKVLVRREGEIDGFVGLTPGSIYYVDPATPGGITRTPPTGNSGKVLQDVGFAITASKLLVILDADFVIL